jgi:hypothetical protein
MGRALHDQECALGRGTPGASRRGRRDLRLRARRPDRSTRRRHALASGLRVAHALRRPARGRRPARHRYRVARGREADRERASVRIGAAHRGSKGAFRAARARALRPGVHRHGSAERDRTRAARKPSTTGAPAGGTRTAPRSRRARFARSQAELVLVPLAEIGPRADATALRSDALVALTSSFFRAGARSTLLHGLHHSRQSRAAVRRDRRPACAPTRPPTQSRRAARWLARARKSGDPKLAHPGVWARWRTYGL